MIRGPPVHSSTLDSGQRGDCLALERTSSALSAIGGGRHGTHTSRRAVEKAFSAVACRRAPHDPRALPQGGGRGRARRSPRSAAVAAPQLAARAAPRIVVVGAGLAGLTAAYRLKQAGYAADVHEASDRVGGRCWTMPRRLRRRPDRRARRRAHRHRATRQIRQLAQELGLALDNLLAAEANGTEPLYYFDGAALHRTRRRPTT